MTLLYQLPAPLRPCNPPIVAVDTETERFQIPSVGWKGKTRTSPFIYPSLVVASFCDQVSTRVYDREEALLTMRDLLLSSVHLVFHNCAFDIRVFEAADPSLRPLFCAAVDSGRIHDTMSLEVLLQIAHGSRIVSAKQLVLFPALATLASKYAGMALNKDEAVRLNFGPYLADPGAIPQGHLRYAALDAQATYRVYDVQRLSVDVYTSPAYCDSPVLPDCTRIFGPLTENIQVKAALAFAWMEDFPVRVDVAHAETLRSRLSAELERFQKALVSFKWAKIGPKTKRFKLKLKAIRSVLAVFAAEINVTIPVTPSGLISTSHDDWSPHIPKISQEHFDAPEAVSEGDTSVRLEIWIRYMRVQKLLATYIHPYASAEFHYPHYKVLGARTSRTACEKPNVQNVPKRKDGIRALFVPCDGQVLLERDYRAAELVALAEEYYLLFGGSVLGRAINSGVDPHLVSARWLAPDLDALPETDRKRFRQAAKALNFGLPGGLGARTLSVYARTAFGVSLSEEQAREHRATMLDSDPQLARYLADRHDPRARAALVARNLGITGEELVTAFKAWNKPWDPIDRSINEKVLFSRLYKWSKGDWEPDLTVPLGFNPKFDLYKSHARSPAGFTRGNCSFTESHNLPFQAGVAAGAKLALWNLYLEWQKDPTAFSPVAFIHDSVLIQAPKDRWQAADEILDRAMVAGLKAVCPHIRVETESTGPLSRWGKDTSPWGTSYSSPSSPSSDTSSPSPSVLSPDVPTTPQYANTTT